MVHTVHLIEGMSLSVLAEIRSHAGGNRQLLGQSRPWVYGQNGGILAKALDTHRGVERLELSLSRKLNGL